MQTGLYDDARTTLSSLSFLVLAWSAAHAWASRRSASARRSPRLWSPYPLVVMSVSFSASLSVAMGSGPAAAAASLAAHALPLAFLEPDLSAAAAARCLLVALAHMAALYAATGRTYVDMYVDMVPRLHRRLEEALGRATRTQEEKAKNILGGAAPPPGTSHRPCR